MDITLLAEKYMTDITNYVNDILKGKIPACQYVKAACTRHKNDLKRKDIFFDKLTAGKAIYFVEHMVHVKGPKSGNPIKLEPWQKFYVGSLFGWKRKSSGLRRFREGALLVCRKNAKTTMAAGIGHYGFVADSELGAEVYCAATTEAQAYILFNIARSMVTRNDIFRQNFGIKVTKELMLQDSTNSTFSPIIGVPRDGTNPSLAIIDEYHEHASDLAYDSLKTGMGAREQPLLLLISTAGTNIKGPCFSYVEYGRDVVLGNVTNDTLFYLEYGIDKEDDWRDFSCWAKANPNLGVSVSEEFLRQQHETAMTRPDKRSEILTKQLNVWNNESAGWIDLTRWFDCGDNDLIMEKFKGKFCYVGLDCASRLDLTAMVIVFREGETYSVFGKYYLPGEIIDLPENSHYRAWEAEGVLTRAGESRTDFHRLEEDLQKLNEEYTIAELGYDPRESEYLIQNIRTWATFPCVDIPQSPAHFSEPMKLLESLYYSGNLVHNNDPIMNWAAANVVLKSKDTKLFYPTKQTKAKKIDPIVALIMAVSRAALANDDPANMFIDFF